MNSNKLFFYTEERDGKNYLSSFNMDYVIRTVGTEGGKSIVLLDDAHEMYMPTQVAAPGGKFKIENRKQEVYSEITLNSDDTKRFTEAANCDICAMAQVAESKPSEVLSEEMLATEA